MENFNKETFLKYFYDIDKDNRYNEYDHEIIDVEIKTATYFKSLMYAILIVFSLAIFFLIGSFSLQFPIVAFKVLSVLFFIVGIINGPNIINICSGQRCSWGG